MWSSLHIFLIFLFLSILSLCVLGFTLFCRDLLFIIIIFIFIILYILFVVIVIYFFYPFYLLFLFSPRIRPLVYRSIPLKPTTKQCQRSVSSSHPDPHRLTIPGSILLGAYQTQCRQLWFFFLYIYEPILYLHYYNV